VGSRSSRPDLSRRCWSRTKFQLLTGYADGYRDTVNTGSADGYFVYKLITAGSVEEKIVATQEQKAALADAILSEDAAGAVKFSADDLEALFEPIPLTPSISPAAKSRPRTRPGT